MSDLAIARSMRGECLRKLGRHDESVSECRLVVTAFRELRAESDDDSLADQYESACATLAETITSLGRHEEALEVWTRLLAEDDVREPEARRLLRLRFGDAHAEALGAVGRSEQGSPR